MPTLEELVRNKKMSAETTDAKKKPRVTLKEVIQKRREIKEEGENKSKAPTFKSNFSKEEYKSVRDELDATSMDVHDYPSIGLAYPLDESKYSIIPKLTDRQLRSYYNYRGLDRRLSDKISNYLKQVIEWIKSNSVKTEKGTPVITLEKYEELFK